MMHPASSLRSRSPRHGGALRVIALSIALVAAVAASIRGCQAQRDIRGDGLRKASPASAASRYEKEVQRYRQDVSAEASRYQAENRRLYNEFTAYLDSSAATAGFNEARASIPKLVKSYGKFGKARKLVTCLALDKLKGTDKTGAMIQADLGTPLCVPCVRASADVCARYNHMVQAMEANRKASAEALSQSAQSLQSTAPMELPLARFQKRCRSVEVGIRKMGQEQALTALSVGLEAVFIRSTVRSIVVLVSRVAAKAAAKGAASAVAPAVDGPLPIGDILAVGGLLWTAYDVHHLAKTLPKDLSRNMSEMVDTLQRDTFQQARDQAAAAFRAYQQAGGDLTTGALSVVQP